MVNKVMLIGNLGKDPEVRFTTGSQPKCSFPVATTEKWKDQSGQLQERTEWHNVVVWGKQAETCGQYLAKGRQVYVEGSIRSRSYDDKDGNKRYITEIVARDVRFLGQGGGGGASKGAPSSFSPPEGQEPGPGGAPDDDMPF